MAGDILTQMIEATIAELLPSGNACAHSLGKYMSRSERTVVRSPIHAGVKTSSADSPCKK
jgi:hypothetical protein